ncbi:hypothetical protein RYH73_11780 [Olivibacter sp. CPCC 100613]|uniref:hypothetical protein n=1 Tax=Olivibacter sp. CPCC 100613 TaxID=3079931 RepID=UPI002FFA2AF2
MMPQFNLCLSAFLFLFLIVCHAIEVKSQGIEHNPFKKTITLVTPDTKLSIVIDYAEGCRVKRLDLNGKNKLSDLGIYTGFRIKNEQFSSRGLLQNIQIKESVNDITLEGIRFGNQDLTVNENWSFRLQNNRILWEITRTYNKDALVEELALPKWSFSDLSTWKGGIFDNGGMVWCKYLQRENDTYGVHTAGVTLWNEHLPDALRIKASAMNGGKLAAKYSHGENRTFTIIQSVSENTMKPRYHLSRFVSQKTDVFAPIEVKKSTVKLQLTLAYVDYPTEYNRGVLPSIDAEAVRELMNTTGRYGVVDNNIVGANGWLTNWKCLHEPFFAQIGMALNDTNYVKNMSATLDQERNQAVLPDGRVLSRWHNAPGDEMQGTYNSQTGYYEAMWGYTIDSQTGYVINTAEQFALNGDLNWLRGHQVSCEKALDWLIKRDSNGNGIFEMMNEGVTDKTASDWLDIVWASFENAFVNAQLFEALRLWSECERVLGSPKKATYYMKIAESLKDSFNKPVEDGGFWLEEKKQYVYWRDNDGAVHGDNLVTPINFAAIAFGLCDDPQRIKLILDQIEKRTEAERLFHWPLCFDSFKREEVSDGNWPFPKYENGDIFPTWGYLGVRAYAKYNKDIALKYIQNILKQYKKDGLSSQRYSRTTQLGLGDDVLSGICTSITALYRDIYGVRPQWNRMGLEPHITTSLNGTKFSYILRGVSYQIELRENDYRLSAADFSVKSNRAFGAIKTDNVLRFYPHNREEMMLSIKEMNNGHIDLMIDSCTKTNFSFNIAPGEYVLMFEGLPPSENYTVLIDNQLRSVRTSKEGTLSLKNMFVSTTHFVLKKIDKPRAD